jgi:TolB-like protein/DNA-binding winged helix-turn-helix (wHTH) protein
MERQATTKLRIGAWCVSPASGEISRNGETARVEVRTMRLLLRLAEHAGEVVSIDDLLNQVWSDVTVAPDSVYQAVASLRRLLGDDPKQPAYIETVPRLGYRMVATVTPWEDQPENGSSRGPFSKHSVSARDSDSALPPASPTSAADGKGKVAARLSSIYVWASGAVVCLLLIAGLLFYGKFSSNSQTASPAVASQPQKSIAVLPFLDLTDDMNQEPFADGMTEELIDKLSKIPGLRVPPPTSSFYFKSKLWPRSKGTEQITIAEIAKALGVAYVLDGSVRKSGTRLRVDARLIRADNGYVVWSETYDRPSDDILMVQDDIASEVTKALRASIESKPD